MIGFLCIFCMNLKIPFNTTSGSRSQACLTGVSQVDLSTGVSQVDSNPVGITLRGGKFTSPHFYF